MTQTTKIILGISIAAALILTLGIGASLLRTDTAASAPRNGLSEQEALSIALSNAGIDKADVEHVSIRAEKENSVSVYEVEFVCDSKEYEYEIRISDGAILSHSNEWNN